MVFKFINFNNQSVMSGIGTNSFGLVTEWTVAERKNGDWISLNGFLEFTSIELICKSKIVSRERVFR